MVRFSRVRLAAVPMCHPQGIKSRQWMRYDGGNTMQYQDHYEGRRALPLKAMECGIAHRRKDSEASLCHQRYRPKGPCKKMLDEKGVLGVTSLACIHACIRACVHSSMRAF